MQVMQTPCKLSNPFVNQRGQPPEGFLQTDFFYVFTKIS